MNTHLAANRPLVLSFDDGKAQAQALAEASAMHYATIELRRFPDGESYVRLPEKIPEHVIILRSLHQANEQLIELILAAQTARTNGAKRISLIAPYLCYMRQDHAFNPGEAVSQQVIGELLARYFDDLLSIDPHLHRTPVLAEAMPVSNAIALSASREISQYLNITLDEEPLILGPDLESEQWAKEIAKPYGWEYAIATKTRFGDRHVNVDVPHVSVANRTVVIIDDISSSGQTLIEAAKQINTRGIRRLYGAVTHALLDETAMLELKKCGFEAIWSTDTIPHKTNAVAIDAILSEAVRNHLQ